VNRKKKEIRLLLQPAVLVFVTPITESVNHAKGMMNNLVVTASNKNPAEMWGFLFFLSALKTCLHKHDGKRKGHWLCQ